MVHTSSVNDLIQPEIFQFFPDIRNDSTLVTWGHAINSKEKLQKALEDDVMMLEADVSAGYLNNDDSALLKPIMAHPPHNTSDMSLDMWLDFVIDVNIKGKKVGIKLDFKDISIVQSSLELLRGKDKLLFPVWLNADILKGPGGQGKVPVDPDAFLSLCKKYFPQATLSVGWTTGYELGKSMKYTYEMFDEMRMVLQENEIHQPITFPIRAAFVGTSLDELKYLSDKLPKASFTIWTSPSDDVDINGLLSFQSRLRGKDIFIDLPSNQLSQLRIRSSDSSNEPLQSSLFIMSLLLVFSIAALLK